jgi:hypothetical protein
MENTEQTIIKKPRGNPAWKKGVSGNKGGRPQGIHERIDEACKKYNLDPIDELVKMANEGSIAPKDRYKILVEILDRRYGKALLTQDIKVSNPEPITFVCLDNETSSNN